MRIKQKELIGKIPQITYTEKLANEIIVIVQVFDKPKCVNMIKMLEDKTIIERQCCPLTDELYQKYIDNYHKYGAHSRVDGLFANSMANKCKDNTMKVFWKRLRNYLWS